VRLAARIDVLAGRFASQPLAYAHLLDAAERQGLSPDLDHVEVIHPPHTPRLRGFFDEGTVMAIATEAREETLVLVLPGALVTGAFSPDARLRRIGRYEGEITRARPAP
jgi:hypothetical protein